MAVRISGLASGLDTDSIVEELVSAYQYKVDSYEKDKTKLEWTEDAWSSLNKDINTFYKGSLSSLRLQGNYSKQSVTVSDTTKATVSASGSATLGTQSLNIIQLAKAGYLTGAKLTGSTSSTTLKSLGYTSSSDATLAVTVGGKTTSLTIGSSTTISDVVKQLSSVDGITASYDATNQRIFVTSSTAGADNDFSLAGSDTNGVSALSALGLSVESSSNTAYYNSWTTAYDATNNPYAWAVYTTDDDGNTVLDETATKANLTTLVKAAAGLTGDIETYNSQISAANDSYTEETAKINCAKAYQSINSAKTEMGLTDDQVTRLKELMSAEESTDDMETEFSTLKEDILTYLNENAEDGTTYTASDVSTKLTSLYTNLATVDSYAETYDGDNNVSAATIQAYVDGTNTDYTYDTFVAACEATQTSLTSEIATANENITAKETELKNYSTLTGAVTITSSMATDDGATALSTAVDSLYTKTSDVYDAQNSVTYSTGATRVDGQDCIIKLNGAEYTGSTNTITVNGISITATGVTGDGEANELSITTNTDTSGIYDMIKSFFSSYNTLINGMTASYNADSAKGYEPLTDDEKDSMSDTEIESWETKIKDALLRRDSTLESLISMFSSSLSKSYYIKDGNAVTYNSTNKCYMYNGSALTDSDGNKITTESALKTWASENNATNYSLASFGISTLGYLNAADNEEYAYHIDGDSDDSNTSGNTDKLKAAISSDPSTVSAFFSALISDTYSSLDNKMQSTTLNSKYTVYNDKKMDSDMDDIEDKIDDWQDKLEDLQDYWYSKFSTMETALAQLQSQQSALSSLLGS